MKRLLPLFALSALLVIPACSSNEPTSVDVEPTLETSNSDLMTVDELIIEDLTVGDGDEATAGKLVTVHYVGTLTDGTSFDSSRERGIPFQFTLGAGQVIEGWDEGFAGMKIGGTRKLTIPSDMAYGPNGIPGVIPGGATLVFEVELLAVE